MKNSKKVLWFKILAWYVGIYHTILGLVGILASQKFVTSLATKIYSFNDTVFSPQFIVIARFAGAYMLALGVMAMMMGSKPQKYKGLVIPIVIMIGARIYTRLFNFSDINSAFGLGWNDNIIYLIVIALIAIGLLSLRPKE